MKSIQPSVCWENSQNEATSLQFPQNDPDRERRQLEALHKKPNFIEAVIKTVGSLVIVLDRQGQIIRFNQACEQTTNYLLDEVKGKPFWDIFLISEEVESVKTAFEQIIAGQFTNEHENYWLTKEGNHQRIA